MDMGSSRLLKNAHLLRYAHPSSLQRTRMYASFLRISRALHLDVFEQPVTDHLGSFRIRKNRAYPAVGGLGDDT
jgi:hypothetical protein